MLEKNGGPGLTRTTDLTLISCQRSVLPRVATVGAKLRSAAIYAGLRAVREWRATTTNGDELRRVLKLVCTNFRRCPRKSKRPPAGFCPLIVVARSSTLRLVGRPFACRRCHDLAYGSQREHQFDRALRRREKSPAQSPAQTTGRA